MSKVECFYGGLVGSDPPKMDNRIQGSRVDLGISLIKPRIETQNLALIFVTIFAHGFQETNPQVNPSGIELSCLAKVCGLWSRLKRAHSFFLKYI